MAPAMKIVFGLLTFVTVGMIIGALLQLAFITRLEDSLGTGIPSLRGLRGQSTRYLRDVSRWSNDKDAEILRLGFVKPEVVSWSPRIIVLHNFLSPEECEYLKAIARPRLQVSTVVDVKTGKDKLRNVSNSCRKKLSDDTGRPPLSNILTRCLVNLAFDVNADMSRNSFTNRITIILLTLVSKTQAKCFLSISKTLDEPETSASQHIRSPINEKPISSNSSYRCRGETSSQLPPSPKPATTLSVNKDKESKAMSCADQSRIRFGSIHEIVTANRFSALQSTVLA